MKKTLIPLLALAFSGAAGLHAQAQDTVTSVNAVGMVKLTLPRGQFSMVSFPFSENETEVLTVAGLFGTSLPSSSIVYTWDPMAQGYVTSIFGTRSGWSNGDVEINRSMGFYIFIPETAQDLEYEVTFSGEVPGGVSNDLSVISLAEGFNFVSIPFPVSKLLSETGLNDIIQSGDFVYFWNGTEWISSSWGTRTGWTNDFVLNPGQGFFFRSSSNKTWEQPKPYLWP